MMTDNKASINQHATQLAENIQNVRGELSLRDFLVAVTLDENDARKTMLSEIKAELANQGGGNFHVNPQFTSGFQRVFHIFHKILISLWSHRFRNRTLEGRQNYRKNFTWIF